MWLRAPVQFAQQPDATTETLASFLEPFVLGIFRLMAILLIAAVVVWFATGYWFGPEF